MDYPTFLLAITSGNGGRALEKKRTPLRTLYLRAWGSFEAHIANVRQAMIRPQKSARKSFRRLLTR